MTQRRDELIEVIGKELFDLGRRQLVQYQVGLGSFGLLAERIADALLERYSLDLTELDLTEQLQKTRAKLEKMTANCEKIAKHNGEYVQKNNELRAEVERLKRVNDEYGVEEVGKLVDRVQELEKLVESSYSFVEDAVTYYCAYPDFTPEWGKAKQWLNDAKRALEGK